MRLESVELLILESIKQSTAVTVINWRLGDRNLRNERFNKQKQNVDDLRCVR